MPSEAQQNRYIHSDIWDRLVQSPTDITGLVAYGVYQTRKREWIAACLGRDNALPSEASVKEYSFSIRDSQLESLRSDAVQIRVCVLMALAQYAFSQASEGVRVNAFRAAGLYTGMAARMTQLLQENAALILPDFVAAM